MFGILKELLIMVNEAVSFFNFSSFFDFVKKGKVNNTDQELIKNYAKVNKELLEYKELYLQYKNNYEKLGNEYWYVSREEKILSEERFNLKKKINDMDIKNKELSEQYIEIANKYKNMDIKNKELIEQNVKIVNKYHDTDRKNKQLNEKYVEITNKYKDLYNDYEEFLKEDKKEKSLILNYKDLEANSQYIKVLLEKNVKLEENFNFVLDTLKKYQNIYEITVDDYKRQNKVLRDFYLQVTNVKKENEKRKLLGQNLISFTADSLQSVFSKELSMQKVFFEEIVLREQAQRNEVFLNLNKIINDINKD